jgi:protein SCO1/2
MSNRRVHHAAPRSRAPLWGASFVVACAMAAAPALALEQDDSPMAPRPRELEGIDIEDKLGAKVPLDVKLTDDEGEAVELGRYFSGEQGDKPVLLVLGYYECPMLCSLVLNGTLEALKSPRWSP